MKTTELSKPPKKSAVRPVPIAVRAPGATDVAITGAFNSWAPEGVRMSHDGNGTWRTALDLSPGEYEYRLIVDGQWRDHPEAPKRVPNPFGSENCVLIVP
ncbi:MAG TPA: glycogen-binding domain-containing protein [Planctomycetota bacterium]|nr:glycogen-binding domain-containing protein [Planctomycetota bacterium]